MHGSPTICLLSTHPNLRLSYRETTRGWKRSQCSAQSTSQAPLFLSQPRSNSLVSLSISLFLSTHTSQLPLNPVSITFVPLATSGQIRVKAQPISSPALLFLPGWTMQMHACSASLSRIYLAYREFKTCLLVSSHAPNLSPALPSFETPPLASSLSSHSIQNCSTHIQVIPHHSSIKSAILLSTLCSFAHPPLFWYTSTLCPTCQYCIWLAWFQVGRSSNLEFLTTLNYVLLHHPYLQERRFCLPQPSPLVELFSMHLRFDDLHLLIYLVVLDFVRA